VPHESETVACARAVKILLESGSHYVTQADFGCKDGVHKSWILVDVDGRDEARHIVPPAYRRHATIANEFDIKEPDDRISYHEAARPHRAP
jgi:hypothetical protein